MKAHASFRKLFCGEKRPISWKLTLGVNEIIYRLYDYSKKGREERKRKREIIFCKLYSSNPFETFFCLSSKFKSDILFFSIVEMHSYKYPHAQKSTIQTLSLHCEGFSQWETWKQNYLCTYVTFSWASWCLLICVCLIFKVSLVYQNGWLQRVQLLAYGVCFLLSSILGQGGQRSQYPLYTFWSSPILTTASSKLTV